jgi:acyl-CoA thioesterase FadM
LYGFISNCGLNKINMAAMTSPAAHIHRRRVEFADTDAAGVAHFSRLLAMVEEAEHGFFRENSLPVLSTESAWPIVGLRVDYSAPCRFGDEIDIRLFDFAPGECSLAYSFEAAIGQRRVFSGRATLCHISLATARPVKQGQFAAIRAQHDFRAVFLYPRLIRPLARFKLAFDIDG